MEIKYVYPEIIIALTSILVFVLNSFFTKENKKYLGYISAISLAISFYISTRLFIQIESPIFLFKDFIVIDKFSLLFKLIFIIISILITFISIAYLLREEINYGEYYGLILSSCVGMMIMSSANELITLFIGLEILSLSLYIMCAIQKQKELSLEAGLKYFMLGAFASGFLLYGIALLYTVGGSTKLNIIQDVVKNVSYKDNLLLLSGLLIVIGFGFKIALVPYHMWAPDVYEGAPTSTTAFMAVAVKSATFAVFIRIFLDTFGDWTQNYYEIFSILAVLTMTVGNIAALVQNNIKRMLAYSSIAQAGYIFVGILCSSGGIPTIMFYLFAYTFIMIGTFSAVIKLSTKGDKYLDIPSYAGIGYKYPSISLCLSIFMFSLIGIPPTGGFFGKFYIFSEAVKNNLILIAVIGVLNSVLSAYYYLRVIVFMYMEDKKELIEIQNNEKITSIIIIICAAITLLLGIFPSTIIEIILSK